MRAAVVKRCPRCHAQIIAGLDDDICATDAFVDPQPLAPLGELHARIDGLMTYDLAWRGVRYEIDWRDACQITGFPPASRDAVDVVAEHRCGRVKIGVDRVRRRRRTVRVMPGDDDEPPPF
jgi:hypothetical protein